MHLLLLLLMVLPGHCGRLLILDLNLPLNLLQRVADQHAPVQTLLGHLPEPGQLEHGQVQHTHPAILVALLVVALTPCTRAAVAAPFHRSRAQIGGRMVRMIVVVAAVERRMMVVRVMRSIGRCWTMHLVLMHVLTVAVHLISGRRRCHRSTAPQFQVRLAVLSTTDCLLRGLCLLLLLLLLIATIVAVTRVIAHSLLPVVDPIVVVVIVRGLLVGRLLPCPGVADLWRIVYVIRVRGRGLQLDRVATSIVVVGGSTWRWRAVMVTRWQVVVVIEIIVKVVIIVITSGWIDKG